jgi:hypothetical protein
MPSTAPPTLWLVFAAKAVRTFCYGYLGVLLPSTSPRSASAPVASAWP